jgi:hypothetical protein
VCAAAMRAPVRVAAVHACSSSPAAPSFLAPQLGAPDGDWFLLHGVPRGVGGARADGVAREPGVPLSVFYCIDFVLYLKKFRLYAPAHLNS